MFGCSEHWIGKRFAHALTGFLSGDDARAELASRDAVDGVELEARHEAWQGERERAAARGADALAMADGTLPNTTTSAASSDDASWTTNTRPVPLGRVHVIPSNEQTVVWGLFDPTREPVARIDSGDVVVYENTWTHFFNRLQPGVPTEKLAEMRKSMPGRGVHSIIGPIAVNGAKPGDLLEVRFLRMRTIDFGANFHNPGAIGTGSLPEDFPDGHVHYFNLKASDGYVDFSPHIKLELRPFQGTFGVAHRSGEAVSSVAPGQHAGNIDVKELTVGSSLYIPVWNDGALIYTGDSHALQGDGEVNITALETAMEEVRVQVILHQNAGYAWPMIETPTHWLMLGLHESLNEALRIALRNTIDFLGTQAKLSRADAYGLASLAVDFRVSQMVDVNNGIHAMIPKAIFAPDFRAGMSIV